jgi:hypothetical protein
MNDTPHPRQLSTQEREWIEWILPSDRSGYKSYRDAIRSMVIIGEGRRGNGEMILGNTGTYPDFSAPLPSVFAYGAIETNFGTISITVREMLDEQISVEIVSQRSENIPEEFEEARRWTYSTWTPGTVCPQCAKPVREIAMRSVEVENVRFVLALCRSDKRLWVYDTSSGVNRLIPVTNFYNELMLHKNIRDPKIALDAKLLFMDMEKYSDDDLTYAFLTYNTLKTKVRIEGKIESETQHNKRSGSLLKKIFSRK